MLLGIARLAVLKPRDYCPPVARGIGRVGHGQDRCFVYNALSTKSHVSHARTGWFAHGQLRGWSQRIDIPDDIGTNFSTNCNTSAGPH